MLEITWVGCAEGNWRAGRTGNSPKAIVIHLMDGTLVGTDAWFNTTPEARKNGNFASSAHYGIGRAGQIHQYVLDVDTAYHAGRVHAPTCELLELNVNPNLWTLGIEHEGYATETQAWPETQVAVSVALIVELAAKWKIPIDRKHIVGHREIFSLKTCPGHNIDLDDLVARALKDAQDVQNKD